MFAVFLTNNVYKTTLDQLITIEPPQTWTN